MVLRLRRVTNVAVLAVPDIGHGQSELSSVCLPEKQGECRGTVRKCDICFRDILSFRDALSMTRDFVESATIMAAADR